VVDGGLDGVCTGVYICGAGNGTLAGCQGSVCCQEVSSKFSSGKIFTSGKAPVLQLLRLIRARQGKPKKKKGKKGKKGKAKKKKAKRAPSEL
jgi:hypothetical protein